MRVEEEYFDVLQNIETAIVAVYNDEPRLLDFDALDALEALIRVYTFEERGGAAAGVRLPERPHRVFEVARRMCEWRLGRSSLNPGEAGSDATKPPPISVAEILLCLKRLRKSVRLWNGQGGRQGYLDYVREFLGDATRGLGA